MQLLQPDEGSCRSEILHARVYGLDLSKGIARAENFFAGLKKNRVRTDGGRTLVAYSTKYLQCTVAWRLGFTELKPCQQSAVKSFVLGQDLFLSLPTGYGKSFCYSTLPWVYDCLKERESPYSTYYHCSKPFTGTNERSGAVPSTEGCTIHLCSRKV